MHSGYEESPSPTPNEPTGHVITAYSVSQKAAAAARHSNTFLDAQWCLGKTVFRKGTCVQLGDTSSPQDIGRIAKELVASIDREQRNQGQDTTSSSYTNKATVRFSGFPGERFNTPHVHITIKCGCSYEKNEARRARGTGGKASVGAGSAPITLNECMAGAEPLGGLSLQQRSKINGCTTLSGRSFTSATDGRFDTQSVSALFNKASRDNRPNALTSTVEFLKVCAPPPPHS